MIRQSRKYGTNVIRDPEDMWRCKERFRGIFKRGKRIISKENSLSKDLHVGNIRCIHGLWFNNHEYSLIVLGSDYPGSSCFQGWKNNLRTKKELILEVFVAPEIWAYSSSYPLNYIDNFQKIIYRGKWGKAGCVSYS